MTLIMGHAPGLYVSEDGRVECAEHAPYAGTDTWRFGHYIRIDAEAERIWLDEERLAGVLEIPPRCEACGKTRKEAELNA